MAKKDDNVVDVEKGDIKVRVKFKAMLALGGMIVLLILGAALLYSSWSCGVVSHDPRHMPKKIMKR